MAENKTKPTRVSVAAYIAALTDEPKRTDAKALVTMMQAASGEKPQMWGPSIIGFGSYHYKYESGREGDMPIIAFSPRKAAIVLYIAAGLSGSKALVKKLGKHSMGKGCLYMKRLADVDETVLKKLVANAVAERRTK
jgi:hypothetical protein